MGKYITLHKQFGVNPSLGVCLICGKETGEILLLGGNKGKEAPHQTVTPLCPCAECREKYLKEGTLFLEAAKDEKGRIVASSNFAIVKDEAVKLILKMDPPREKIVLVEPETFENMFTEIPAGRIEPK